MSLLLKTMERVGLGEALRIAIDEGLFPNLPPIPHTLKDHWDYASARRELFRAYAARNTVPLMRLAYESGCLFDVTSIDEPSPKSPEFVVLPCLPLAVTSAGCFGGNPDTGLDSHMVNRAFRVSDPITAPRITDRDWVIVHRHADFEGRAGKKSELAYIYHQESIANERTLGPLTWGDLLAGDRHLENALLLDVQTLMNVIARAKSDQPQFTSIPALASSPVSTNALPPRTASTYFKEYRAMAEVIAKLSDRKAATVSELAAVVMDECAKAGIPMPVEQRTVTARLEKA